MDKEVIDVLRAQAWERAKGELTAALAASYSRDERWERADKSISDLIKEIEDNGLMD